MKTLAHYKNGNYVVRLYEDGTKIRASKDDTFVPEFAENIDIKITNSCAHNCRFCHEGSTPNGLHGDIMNLPFFDSLHEGQEVALGGGNVLEHPDFENLLHKLKDKKVITNITLQLSDIRDNLPLIDRLSSEDLIYGIGCSISRSNEIEDFLEIIYKLKNKKIRERLVFHLINGLPFFSTDLETLNDCGKKYKDIKVLVLGYKKLRRGLTLLNDISIDVKADAAKVYKYIKHSNFKTISFDNLALEQLDIKSVLSEKEWNLLYMGDDGTSTFYIDCVTETFAQSSTAPFDKRYPLMDNVDDMFKTIVKENR